MKICSNPNCPLNGEPQPLENFSKRQAKKDGLRSQCKTCDSVGRKRYYQNDGKDKAKNWITRHPEKRSEYKKRYNHSEKGKTKKREYARSPNAKESRKRYQRTENAQDKQRQRRKIQIDRVKARKAVEQEIRKGALPKIKTLTCSRCGQQAEHYHHHKGYEKEFWLDVVPLCALCHAKIHTNG